MENILPTELVEILCDSGLQQELEEGPVELSCLVDAVHEDSCDDSKFEIPETM